MKLKFRIDSQNSQHVHCSVFSDENDCGTYALLGKLYMTRKEYKAYTKILERDRLLFLDFGFTFDKLKNIKEKKNE